MPGVPRPDLILVVGLLVFGFAFAVISSLHSYLILAYAGSEKAAEDVGFYYAANAAGRLIGILLSGLLTQAGGMPACLWGSAVMLAICLAITLLLPTGVAARRSAGMTTSDHRQDARPAPAAMGLFERYLTLWVALCIVAGIALGQLVPALFHAHRRCHGRAGQPAGRGADLADDRADAAEDRFRARSARSAEHWRGIAVTVGVNWLVKPFSMALLGWLFIGWLFRPLLPADQIDSYIAGLILLAAAPCTAMVFVWSNLVDGEPHFTLSQVALNDTIMVVAFAPIVGLLLGLSSITRAVGHAVAVGRALHRRAGHRRPALAAGAAAARRRGRAGAHAAPAGSRSRWSRCSPRWCCCSASRASRSCASRWSSCCWRCRS